MNNQRCWTALNAITKEAISTHVRVDTSLDKKVWWVDKEGNKGLPEGINVTDLALYGIQKAQLDRKITVVEGEPCADALMRLNLNAVGTMCGAATIPGDDALNDLLKFPGIVLWSDNDEPGYKHMRRIESRLLELGAKDISVVSWSDAPDKGDCVDAIKAGVDVAELIDKAQIREESHKGKRVTAVRFYSAIELQSEEPEQNEYVCEPWVVAGSITEVSGKVKLAGKTTFVTNLCSSITKGESFLGHPTSPTTVIYMTEQPKSSFLEALRRARLTEQNNFHAVFHNQTRGIPWSELITQVVTRAIESSALIVIDTLPQFVAIKGDGENNTGDALAAMEPIQLAASNGLGVIIVRHERKSGGDLGDSARGSSAFGGAVDTLISIKKVVGHNDDNVRVISAVSRFDGVPSELYVELTETGYVSLGSSGAVAEGKAIQLILESAPVSEGDAMSLDEFTESIDSVKKTTASKVLRQLIDEGKLRCHGIGKKGSPYRYWRA